jgi:hypothetical protein
MFLDHNHTELKDLYREEALPLDAVKALMFDDETEEYRAAGLLG